MKTLDELVADKILDLVHYVLSKFIKPDMTLSKVNELDVQAIEKLKQQYGIEAIILDVDDTLRKEMKDIPKCNKEWIEGLKDKIKIMIVSNGVDKDIEKYFNKNGIDYIGFACKPLKKNFKRHLTIPWRKLLTQILRMFNVHAKVVQNIKKLTIGS